MSRLRPQRRRVPLHAPISVAQPSRARGGRSPRPYLRVVLVAVATALFAAPTALASPGLPPMGVPLGALLHADPTLSDGLALAGSVHRPGTPGPGALLAARTPRGAGSIVQVRPGQQVFVHRTPGGQVVQAFDDRSDSYAQPRAFTVYRLGPPGWLGVSIPALRGRLGWIHVDAGVLSARPATEEIHVSLHRRMLTLLRNGRVVLRTRVVIGAPRSPTPTGHFSVDDKRRFTPADPAYGIGALALSVPPAGRDWLHWRVAIHGVDNVGRLGASASLGCVHVPARQLARLLRSVPVGTPVDITR